MLNFRDSGVYAIRLNAMAVILGGCKIYDTSLHQHEIEICPQDSLPVFLINIRRPEASSCCSVPLLRSIYILMTANYVLQRLINP
jgi:hypothetical protein